MFVGLDSGLGGSGIGSLSSMHGVYSTSVSEMEMPEWEAEEEAGEGW